MADTKPTPPFTIEGLSTIGARFFDRADAITAVACQDLAANMRLAARITDKLASLRFRIAEIAAKAIEHPDWDNAAIARDLRDALDASAREAD